MQDLLVKDVETIFNLPNGILVKVKDNEVTVDFTEVKELVVNFKGDLTFNINGDFLISVNGETGLVSRNIIGMDAEKIYINSKASKQLRGFYGVGKYLKSLFRRKNWLL